MKSEDNQEKKYKEPTEFTYMGETLSLEEWAEKLDIPVGTIRSRWRAGWSIVRILDEPTTTKTREELRNNVYKFILKYKKNNNGLSPTMREIAESCGTTTSNIKSVLDQLQENGLITMEPGSPRSIIIPGGEWIPPV